MSLEPRILWPVFTGLVFILMGFSLAADAETHAASALDWQRQAQPSAPGSVTGLIWAYRAFGAGFAGAGIWLLAGWVFFRADLLARLGAAATGPSSAPAAGGALLICGGGMAALRTSDWMKPRAHSFVEAELASALLTFRHKIALWCGRLIVSLFVVFGILLITRSHP